MQNHESGNGKSVVGGRWSDGGTVVGHFEIWKGEIGNWKSEGGGIELGREASRLRFTSARMEPAGRDDVIARFC